MRRDTLELPSDAHYELEDASWIHDYYLILMILDKSDDLGSMSLAITLFIQEKCVPNRFMCIHNRRVVLFKIPILIRARFDNF
jgi:hypothetical protein